MPLHPDVALDVQLSAICSRNRYTKDPGPVLAELRAVAGDRVDVLAKVAGSWAGYYDNEHTHTLAAAMLELDGVGPWVELGRQRRTKPPHGTTGFAR